MHLHSQPRIRHRVLLGYAVIVCIVAGILSVAWPQQRAGIGVMLAAGLGAAWVVALLSTRRIRRQVRRLRETAEAIRRGESAGSLQARTPDDFVKLTESMRQISEQLQQTIREQEQLRRRLTRSEKLAIIGELAATVAHEINNPLDGLQNSTRIIRRCPENIKQTLELLELMDAGLYRIEMIVRRLLAMSRDESIHALPTRMDEIVNDAILFVQPRLNRNSIRLIRDFPERPVLALADRVQMAQVLINLMINAADAMSSGGTLTIACAKGDGARVLLDVTDTGTGIDEAHRPHLFEPFYTTKPRGVGTGLGLTVAARIVEAHHGRLEVTTEMGKGTRFRIEIPGAPAEPVVEPASQPVKSALEPSSVHL